MKVKLVFLIAVASSQAVWLSDMFTSKGWRFGDDMYFHIEDSKAKNVSFFDRLALRVNYGNLEISAVQHPERNAVGLDFYEKDKEEGRGKKMGNMMLPFAIGAIKAALATMAFAGVKLLVLKSIMVAKVAIMFSFLLLIAKLSKHEEGGHSYVEVEHHGSEHYPGYVDYGHSGYGGSGGYSNGYPSYGLSAAESSLHYAGVHAPGANGTVPQAKQQLSRRRDVKRKNPTILTITRYSKPDTGLI